MYQWCGNNDQPSCQNKCQIYTFLYVKTSIYLSPVRMLCLGLGTKNNWLGLGKQHAFAYNTCFGCHHHGWRCLQVFKKHPALSTQNSCKYPQVSLKISIYSNMYHIDICTKCAISLPAFECCRWSGWWWSYRWQGCQQVEFGLNRD